MKEKTHKERLLIKFSKYGLEKNDLLNAEKSYTDFLSDEIELRDKLINNLSNSVLNDKSIDHPEVIDTLNKYSKLINIS